MNKEARLYRRIGGGDVECCACARRCRLKEGARGFCQVRQNLNGRLCLLHYGSVSSLQIDPIEKKPFNHFMPGSRVLSIGTTSCNFRCSFCQNHDISKVADAEGTELSPKKAVALAVLNRAKGIAYTYNEPTIFLEYALDVAKEARKSGLFNVFVTNGFMTDEAIGAMTGLIDAAVVNFKGNGEREFVSKYQSVPSSDRIRESLIMMRKAKIHTEITDLIVPRVGDSLDACDDLTRWIFRSLGADTPLQFTRFYPEYKMMDVAPTPYATLKKHYDIAKKNGLRYAYIGNSPGNAYENTYCPACGAVAIGRNSYGIANWNLDEKMRCSGCGSHLGVFGNADGRIAEDD
ncbi:Radical SAM superfamily protein [uncultured archaeon]|nr:Radical SAM superfamily protein [uncultured archaeon]